MSSSTTTNITGTGYRTLEDGQRVEFEIRPGTKGTPRPSTCGSSTARRRRPRRRTDHDHDHDHDHDPTTTTTTTTTTPTPRRQRPTVPLLRLVP